MAYLNDEKILLILDIDETLVHATSEKLDVKVDFQVFDYNVYKRPFLNEFLHAVAANFTIAIWSSASDDYAEEVVQKIVPAEVPLAFVWGRSRCTYKRNLHIDEFGYYDNDPWSHYQYIKPLKKLKRKGYNLNRILIVDDTPHKAKDNYGNAIYPSEFVGDPNDDELLQLTKYLETLKNQANVRRLEKRWWRQQVDPK